MSEPKDPPTWDELQALLPWAHIEPNNWDELVIFTGLILCDDGESTEWLEGLVEVPDE